MSNSNTSNLKGTRRKRLRRRLLLSMAFLAIIAQTSCNSNQNVDPVTKDNYFLDTTCSVSVYEINGGLDEEEATKAIDKAYDRCRELDKLLTNKKDSSDVAKINNAKGAWVTVGDDAVKVIRAGIRYGKLSDGMFDITIGTVTDLWDFHSDDPKVPLAQKLAEAVSHVDYRQIHEDGNRIRMDDPSAKIDLGGIAKGYVGDEMRKVLKKEGVTSAVINLGGNIVTIGTKPDGSKFTVGIEKPFSDRSEIIGKTQIGEGTVVTSGIYERQFVVKGKRYHHILNPKTGYPVDTDLEAVSLVTEKKDSMDLDAMSTICLMKGTAGAKKFIASQSDLEAVFCGEDDKISTTKNMDFTEE